MNGPMYMQIAEGVRHDVASGAYRPGQMLPTERVFMQKFSVSRVTIRRALKELVDESVIEVRQGCGYIVKAYSHLTQPLNRITSFSEDCKSRGLTPGSIVLSKDIGKSNDDESAHFDVDIGTTVQRIKRIRTGDKKPFLVECATLLQSNAPRYPWPQGSLYRALADSKPTRVQQQYIPVVADNSLAKHLDVTEGSPLMLVTRAGFSNNNKPVEYSHCWFRPDRWTFAHEIR